MLTPMDPDLFASALASELSQVSDAPEDKYNLAERVLMVSQTLQVAPDPMILEFHLSKGFFHLFQLL
jgi:hypothetical protein